MLHKNSGPEDRSSARLIVRYPNGLEAPLESHGATDLMDMGFRLAAESVHIMRGERKLAAHPYHGLCFHLKLRFL